MENTAFLDELKALTASEDLLAVSREVNELSAHFEPACRQRGGRGGGPEGSGHGARRPPRNGERVLRGAGSRGR